VETDELVRRLVRHEDRLTRLCISMVTHGRAYADTLDIARRITTSVAAPLSLLVAPPTLNQARLQAFHDAGADMIGIGLDAVTEDLFRSLRSDVPRGGLKWSQYWQTVDAARAIFGPWKVNCHTLVGLGERDADLMAIFARLLERQIFSYLFCFNPEPDSRMGDLPKTPLGRWRRIQLAKFLLEERGIAPEQFEYDDEGALVRVNAPRELIDSVVADGHAFMTNGCPSSGGEPGCTRPMGSWRPTEAPRDFPWRPRGAELAGIREALDLDGLVRHGPGPSRPPELCAPPAAGRVSD
jgi:biotin synthase